jgi:hypothetical protein
LEISSTEIRFPSAIFTAVVNADTRHECHLER